MNAVEFSNVSRSFMLHIEKHNTFQERMVNMFRPRNHGEIFWALQDVSFEIARGTTLGLIGHNGSGKSTTLKLVTRILQPTRGQIAVRGRVSALLELGSGFHPDLTGRDNIYLNGSLLGFNRSDMQRRIEEIIDFAELGPFIDTPVKHFSSGMYMRLGFAIATAVDPDILITDEVLAVGDETFQRKCMNRIHEFREEGRTILFVSHSLEAVRNLCSQTIWLDHGRVMAAGDTNTTLEVYLRWVNQKDRERIEHERDEREQAEHEPVAREGIEPAAAAVEPSPEAPSVDHNRWGSREAEIYRVELLNQQGQPQDVFQTGGPLTVRMYYDAHTVIKQPVFGLAIYHRNGFQINGPNSRFAGYPIEQIAGRGYVDYVVDALPLLAGEYLVSTSIYDDAMLHAYDHRDRQFSLVVHATSMDERYGTFKIPSHWRHVTG